YGGALSLAGFRGDLVNNTITDNTCTVDAGAILMTTSPFGAPRLMNNIVAHNSSGLNVTSTGGPSTVERANIFYANLGYNRKGAAPSADSTPYVFTNPLFVDRMTGDYH